MSISGYHKPGLTCILKGWETENTNYLLKGNYFLHQGFCVVIKYWKQKEFKNIVEWNLYLFIQRLANITGGMNFPLS